MNPVSARLLNQQLICPQFAAPHEVVRWMGAMQGQDYRMVRWAVGMRTKRPSVRAFARDFDSGRIVRVHLFRTTWSLLVGIAIVVLQIVLLYQWSKKHQRGPLETLWRKLTWIGSGN